MYTLFYACKTYKLIKTVYFSPELEIDWIYLLYLDKEYLLVKWGIIYKFSLQA